MQTNRTYMMATAAPALALALSLVGCDSGGEPEPARKKVDTSPHLRVSGCRLPDSSVSFERAAEISGSFGEADACYGQGNGTVEVMFDATPDAPLAVGDTTLTVGADGTTYAPIDLDPYILNGALSMVLGGGTLAPVVVPVRLEPPGAPAIIGELKIEIQEPDKRVRALLASVPTGTPLPYAKLGSKNPPARVAGSLVYIPADKYDAPTAIGKPASLGQLDLVAIARDGAVREAPAECGPYDHFGMLPHKLVPVDVDVFEVATGKLVVTKHVDQDFEDCSMFMSGQKGEKPPVYSRPKDEAVAQALIEITAAR
jgi:hypothetical protein